MAVSEGTEKTSEISRAMESQNGLFGNHNPTADGSLNNYPVEQKDEIDLTVHTSGKPVHNMYLRGFTGGTYQGNYWSGVDQKDFADAFSEADSGWQVQNILYRYIGSRSSEGEGTVTVTRENPGGDYGYIPYGCAVPDDENVQADGCYASAGKEISYQGYVNWTEWMDPQPSKDAESEIESAYREYVAKEYLKVPVEGLDRLRSYCEQQNLQSVQEVIDFVVRDVQEGRTYSMDLEQVPADQDFAEYFSLTRKRILYSLCDNSNADVPSAWCAGEICYRICGDTGGVYGRWRWLYGTGTGYAGTCVGGSLPFRKRLDR